MNPEKQQALIRSAWLELVADGLLRPLAVADAAALQRWQDMDLCAMVEGAFAERTDPQALSALQRRSWLERLGDRYRSPTFQHSYCTPFWLLDKGDPVGTLAIDTMPTGPGLVPLTALYLVPSRRQTGISARTLDALQQAVVRLGGGGIRLATYWVWQDAVRYYLRRGFWLFHWKHDLVLMRHRSLPAYRVEIAAAEARFLVLMAGTWQTLYRAERHEATLRLFKEPLARDEAHAYFTGIHGEATLAVALALAGWPLVRSAQDWEQHRYADTGAPEGLAYRIEWYEALARKHAWHVETPRLPGLRYPSYAELHGTDEDPAPVS